MWQEKWTDETTKSRVLNEASLKSKKIHVMKCPRIILNCVFLSYHVRVSE